MVDVLMKAAVKVWVCMLEIGAARQEEAAARKSIAHCCILTVLQVRKLSSDTCLEACVFCM
jgi:hypothetical protein